MTEQQQKAAGIQAAKASSDKVEALERAAADSGSLEIEQEGGEGARDPDEYHQPVVRPARDEPTEG
jgi:hypothetical protein